ncbi:MAG: cupin domain-containing protein [Planctomycetes bacterium]|nr:cupin domain-containing protein [Planctomycetota bacterium]
MNIIKLKEKVTFSNQFSPQILYVSPDLKVPLICLEAGQEIPPHPSGTGIFCVLEGKGSMVVENEEVSISPGQIVIAPKGSKRGIKGVENVVALAFHVSS